MIKSLIFIFSAISLGCSNKSPCSVSGIGFHIGETMAIKFNEDGRWNSSDYLLNIPKSFKGSWEQKGNKIITLCDWSSTGKGIGQENIYFYDCQVLTISNFTLTKD